MVVTILNLDDNSLGPVGGEYLALLLQENGYITSLVRYVLVMEKLYFSLHLRFMRLKNILIYHHITCKIGIRLL